MQKPLNSVHANYWNALTAKAHDYNPTDMAARSLLSYLNVVTVESTFDRIRNMQTAYYKESVDRLVRDTCRNYESCKPVMAKKLTENSKVSIAIAVFGFLLTLVNVKMYLSGNEKVSVTDVFLCVLCCVGGLALWYYDLGHRRRQLKHKLLWLSAIQDAATKNSELLAFLDSEILRCPRPGLLDRSNAEHLEIELFHIYRAAEDLIKQR